MPLNRPGDQFVISLRNRLKHQSPTDHSPTEQCSPNFSQHSVPHKQFLDLPVEIIRAIVHSLDDEHRVLLGLTCKYLYTLLRPDVDFTLSDVPIGAKARILQRLERAYSEYLVCRVCGFMFNWQGEKGLWRYQCPHTWGRPNAPKAVVHPLWTYSDTRIRVSREMIDLVFRARKYGIRHGLSSSVLNTGGPSLYGVHRRTEARFLNGQLLLLVHAQMNVNKPGSRAEVVGALQWSLCIHQKYQHREIIWGTVWEFASSSTMSSVERELPKCPHCATDAKLFVQRGFGGRLKIELKVWRNFGSREEEEDQWLTARMFCAYGMEKIDAVLLSQRNLQAEFESHNAVHGDRREFQQSRK